MPDAQRAGHEIIRSEGLFLHEQLQSKTEVLDFISKQAVALGFADNYTILRADLERRESSMTTGLMCGFAIPHAKSEAIQKTAVLFIRNERELNWKTLDDSKVKYLFALLVPNDGSKAHLEMLSKLATCLLEEKFRDRVTSEHEPDKLLAFIKSSIR